MKVVVSSRRLYSKLAHLGLALVLVVVAGTQSACVTTPVTGRSQFNLLSLEDDKALGAQAYEEMLQGAPLVQSGPQYDQVQRVVGRLVEVADADPEFEGQFDWEARLVKDDATVNAWCLPGGKMAVYTGILPFTQDDTGLAVVMAHEIGHAVARHGSERMSQSIPVQVLLQWAAGEYGQGAAQLGAQVANLGVFMPWGRKQELEADHIGLMYMAEAGYDPRVAEQFWTRMGQGQQGAPPEFLSTHPSDESRIQQIRDLLPEALKLYQGAQPHP